MLLSLVIWLCIPFEIGGGGRAWELRWGEVVGGGRGWEDGRVGEGGGDELASPLSAVVTVYAFPFCPFFVVAGTPFAGLLWVRLNWLPDFVDQSFGLLIG